MDNEKLNAARARHERALIENERLRNSINQEMQDKANQGHLWTNGHCADWYNYESSLIELHSAEAELLAALKTETGK